MSNLHGFWKENNSIFPEKKKKQPVKKQAIKWSKRKLSAEKKKIKQLRKAGVKPIGDHHPDYVKDDGFYKTRAWRTLRMAALVNSEGVCSCCGARASDGVQLHVDHIIPRWKAPQLSLEISNLQILCDDCNIGKGAWDDTDWRNHWKNI